MDVIDTDKYLEMPISSRYLYQEFCLRADDDGFVSAPIKICRMVGCTDDDLKVLIAKGYIMPFKSGVCVVSHWLTHNTIRKDRYKPTVYQEEFRLLSLKDGVYCLDSNPVHNTICDNLETKRQPMVAKWEPQVKLSKDNKYICANSCANKAHFETFWDAYPKKKDKAKAQKAFAKLRVNDELLNEMLSAIENQKKSDEWTRGGGQFIPYPSSCLNGRRWEDETDNRQGEVYNLDEFNLI